MKPISQICYQIGSACLIVAVLSGCGGGENDVNVESTGPTIYGQVAKGPVTGATVRIYALDNNGNRGPLLGTTVTTTGGGFQLQLPQTSSAFLIEANLDGADIIDEISGKSYKGNPGEQLSAVFVPAVAANLLTANVTPFSTMATEVARRLSGNNTLAPDAINAANLQIRQWVGVDHLTSNPQTELLTALTSVAQLVNDKGSLGSTLSLLTGSIQIGSTGTILISDQLRLELLDACNRSGINNGFVA